METKLEATIYEKQSIPQWNLLNLWDSFSGTVYQNSIKELESIIFSPPLSQDKPSLVFLTEKPFLTHNSIIWYFVVKEYLSKLAIVFL